MNWQILERNVSDLEPESEDMRSEEVEIAISGRKRVNSVFTAVFMNDKSDQI